MAELLSEDDGSLLSEADERIRLSEAEEHDSLPCSGNEQDVRMIAVKAM